jgi:hypothetical protein
MHRIWYYWFIRRKKMLKELLKNSTWNKIKDIKDFKVDWEKPFVANKKLFTNDEERNALKQAGIVDPFSISGSKAKKIVKEYKQRFKEIFTNSPQRFDKESLTRMKWGAVSEELIMTEIVPSWLTSEEWQDKVLILDKRRYSHPEYPFISVEYDVLAYKTDLTELGRFKKPDPTESCWVINPETEEDYKLIDEAKLEPYMILDLKNTQNDIVTNTKDYVYQLSLGCWMNPEFKYWSILGFIKNANVDWYQQVYNVAKTKELFDTYNDKYLPLVINALNEIELTPEHDEENLVEHFVAQLKDDGEQELELGDEVITTHDLDAYQTEEVIKKLENLSGYLAEKKRLELKVTELTNEIKEYQVPLNSKLFGQTESGKVSWSKYITKGGTDFKMDKFENELFNLGVWNDTTGKVLKVLDVEGKTHEINLETYTIKKPDTIREFPRFTPTEEEKIRWQM